jgi:hypothetical protein
MQLTASLTEAEITSAVRARLAEKLPNIPDDIEVNYTQGRGANSGLSAEVKIDMGDSPLKTATTSAKVSVRKPQKKEEAPQVEKPAAEEAEEVVVTAEAETEKEADPAPFEVDAEVATTPRPSLFAD